MLNAALPVLQNYKNTMQTQILESAEKGLSSAKFGAILPDEKLKDFQEEQIGQLYELMLESTKSNRQFDIQEDTKWYVTKTEWLLLCFKKLWIRSDKDYHMQ